MALGRQPTAISIPASRLHEATSWVFVAVASILICAIGLLAREHWSPLLDLDHDVTTALVVRGSGPAVHRLRLLTDLGTGLTRAIIVGIIVIWLAISRRWRLAVFGVLAASLVTPLTQLLKALFDRPRPEVPGTAFFAGFSFPSGHSSGAAMLGGVLVVVAWNVAGGQLARAMLAVAAVLAAGVGYSRIALGAHFLTDVLAGWLLGVIMVVVLAHACGVWPSRPDVDQTLAREAPAIGAADS